MERKMAASRNTRSCTTKSMSLIILIATLIVITWKMNFKSNLCLDDNVPQSYQDFIDQKDRFLHSISKFKVSHSAPGLNLFIYTAFLDERYNKSVLRIFGIEEAGGVSVDFKCVFKNEAYGQKVVTEIMAKRYWVDTSWPSWSPYFAVEYNCAFPDSKRFENTLFTTTDDKIQLNVPIERPSKFKSHNRQDLAVCIKPLTGYQGTYKLVEWIETLKAAGYSHIIIYQSDVTGPGRHILEYYQQKGIVSVINFPYLVSVIQNVENPNRTSQQRFAMYQQLYLLAMHDCLYRFSTLYRYIAFHDLDEIILPGKEETISEMLKRAEKLNPDAAAFTFETTWHWEEAGQVDTNENIQLLYMQQYAKSVQGEEKHPKSIVSTDRTITMNFNEVLDVPRKNYKSIMLSPSNFGCVHHFRGVCKNQFSEETCGKMLQKIQLDQSVTRYRHTVSVNFNEVVSHVQMT